MYFGDGDGTMLLELFERLREIDSKVIRPGNAICLNCTRLFLFMECFEICLDSASNIHIELHLLARLCERDAVFFLLFFLS